MRKETDDAGAEVNSGQDVQDWEFTLSEKVENPHSVHSFPVSDTREPGKHVSLTTTAKGEPATSTPDAWTTSVYDPGVATLSTKARPAPPCVTVFPSAPGLSGVTSVTTVPESVTTTSLASGGEVTTLLKAS